jgi:hypothetical protein
VIAGGSGGGRRGTIDAAEYSENTDDAADGLRTRGAAKGMLWWMITDCGVGGTTPMSGCVDPEPPGCDGGFTVTVGSGSS